MENTIQLPPIPASILGISNITVENVEIINNNEFIITVRSTEKEILCQKCGRVTSPHGNSPAIKLRHLPIFGKKTYIQITPARGRCDNCKGSPTTTQTSNWYNKSNRQTKVYEEYMMLLLINSTISDVSIKEDIGYKAVEGIVDRYIETEVDWSKVSKIGLLGLDEISLKKGYQDYVTLITSKTENGVRILGVLKGREKATVKAFLASIPKHLQKTIIAICSDMYDGFINAAQEVFGENIPVIADRYHVSKLYRKCLVSLRKKELKRIKKSLSKEEYLSLKTAISLLCKRKELSITDEEKQILEPLFNASPKIKEAYYLCLKLTSIYNRHSTIDEALQSIDNWILEVESSKLTCFKDFIKSLKKYKKEICNYFINRNSSGFVEGFNNKAKVLKRRCYGITNIKHLFQRLVLDFSGYDQFLNNSDLQMA
tara:strand:- start:125 stop:1408 length:1284 start_codon:yes stop_codon:yes gene_type:complete